MRGLDILDPFCIPTPEPMPELHLLGAVIRLACIDLHDPDHADDATTFIASTDFDLFCEVIGWNPALIRRLAAAGVNRTSRKHHETKERCSPRKKKLMGYITEPSI